MHLSTVKCRILNFVYGMAVRLTYFVFQAKTNFLDDSYVYSCITSLFLSNKDTVSNEVLAAAF